MLGDLSSLLPDGDSSCSGTASAIDDVGEVAQAGVKRKRPESSDDDEVSDVDSDCEVRTPTAIFGSRGLQPIRRRIQHQYANAVWKSRYFAGMYRYLEAHQVEGEKTVVTMTQLERLTDAWEAEKGIDLGPWHRLLEHRRDNMFRVQQRVRAMDLGLESRVGPWPLNVGTHDRGWSRITVAPAERY